MFFVSAKQSVDLPKLVVFQLVYLVKTGWTRSPFFKFSFYNYFKYHPAKRLIISKVFKLSPLYSLLFELVVSPTGERQTFGSVKCLAFMGNIEAEY